MHCAIPLQEDSTWIRTLQNLQGYNSFPCKLLYVCFDHVSVFRPLLYAWQLHTKLLVFEYLDGWSSADASGLCNFWVLFNINLNQMYLVGILIYDLRMQTSIEQRDRVHDVHNTKCGRDAM